MLATTFILGVIAIAAVGAFVFVRPRGLARGEFHLFRCGACSQKVRYLASKAGRPAMCPRCGQKWTLPAGSRAFSTDENLQPSVGRRRMLARPLTGSSAERAS